MRGSFQTKGCDPKARLRRADARASCATMAGAFSQCGSRTVGADQSPPNDVRMSSLNPVRVALSWLPRALDRPALNTSVLGRAPQAQLW